MYGACKNYVTWALITKKHKPNAIQLGYLMKQEANVVGIYTAAIRENLVTQGPVLWTLYSVVYRLQPVSYTHLTLPTNREV